MKNIFITGTTGFLGSYFLYHLLQHTENKVYCLARPRPGISAEERVKQSLRMIDKTYTEAGINNHDFEEKLTRNCTVISGNIEEENLGLNGSFEMEEIDEFWHIAANVQFLSAKRDEIMATNVEAGKNVLKFINRNHIPLLNYISTAYVAGQKKNNITETLADENYPVNNVYEESKRLMEKEIIEAHARNECNYRIFRPGIIVGHSITHEPDSSCGGVYGFLSLGLSMKREVENKYEGYCKTNSINVFAESDPALSLITVDHVVDIFMQVADKPESINNIYHVTPEMPTDLKNFALTTRKLLGMNITFTEDRTRLNLIDRLFDRVTQRYMCYLLSSKEFEIKKTSVYCSIPEGQYRLTNKILYKLIEKFCLANKNKTELHELKRITRIGFPDLIFKKHNKICNSIKK